MKSKQFYWNLESLWEKYYEKTSIKINSFFDFTPSKNPVFFDDNENNKPYFGLKNDAQIIEKNNKNIFLTDNHHKVFSFLFDQFLKNKQKIIIIHIDAHRDDAIFQNYEKCKFEIEEVKKYIKNIKLNNNNNNLQNLEKLSLIKKYIKIIEKNCRISDYLDIALHLGFVEKIISITQSYEFLEFLEKEDFYNKNFKNQNIILNLDIDIYGPEGEAVNTKLKTEAIAKSWTLANAVCIATSPAFIDENMAEKIINIMI